MEPTLMPETELDAGIDEHILVHAWRAERLRELGVPAPLADEFADDVDWRAIAALVERGCPPEIALEIVR